MKKRWLAVLVVVTALALVLPQAQAAWAQEGVVLIAEEVDVQAGFPRIRATVTVANPSGVPVAGLERSDFEVLEDGQPVTVDEVISQPNLSQPIAVCIVLDLSGSAPLDQVQAAASQFLDTLSPDDRVCLIGFNTPLDFNTADPTKEVEFTADKDLVRAVIEGLTSIGDTAVYEAIYKGVLWTADETAERRAVVVMTDGFDTISRPEIATADTPKATARDKHIPIFTVGVYNPDFASNPDYLRVLADETGGEYYEADPNNPQEIADRFQAVGDLLRLEYQLAFRSKLEPLKEEDHVVTIRAITPAGVGEIQRTLTYQAPSAPLIVELRREVNKKLQTLEAGEEVRGSVLLVPRIAARNPIVQVEYYVDGADQPTHVAIAEGVDDFVHERWEWRWHTRRLPEGEHTIEAVAYDDAGNTSERFPLRVQVAYPQITIVGVSLNPWVVVAIVAGLVFFIIVLFLLLRRSTRYGVEPGVPSYPSPPPFQGPTAPEAPETWRTAQSPMPAASSPPPVERVPTAFTGPPAEGVGQPLPPTISRRREPEAMGWLVVEKGAQEGREYRLGEVTDIGRSGENDIVLDDPAASRQHAKVRLEDGSFTIFDLGAKNPTEVNGQEIGRHRLMDGDRITIGKTVLVFKQIERPRE